MRIALAQINPTVGDLAGNTLKHLDAIARAAERGAELVIFPELSIVGYPPRDLLLKPDVIERCERAVGEIAAACTDVAAIVGYPAVNPEPSGRPLLNCAGVLRRGRVVHRHVKHLLPTYDVFDETRYFEPGPRLDLATVQGTRLGISVCEDLWNDREVVTRPLYHENPIDRLAAEGAQLFINCSASPFVLDKHEFRLRLLSHTARKHRIPIAYVNQVGGNDELVFDGNSCVLDEGGNLVAQAKDFEEDLLIVDLPGVGIPGDEEVSRPVVCGGVNWSVDAPATAHGRLVPHREGVASVYAALVLGLRDYCRKCGFGSVVLGLSGGIDSAVAAALGVAALGAGNVTGVAMPSRFSSAGSVEDAEELARRMGMKYHLVPIEPLHAAMERLLEPIFAGTAPGVAEENVQARLRGNILMAVSNKFGSMLLTTGNKSELATGYCTLYGDMAGGLAVISDVPKLMVYSLARYINQASPLCQQFGGPVIPESSITKPPSAELRPNQTDQDSLPPYEQLDQIVERYVERLQPVRRIAADTGIDAATVQRIVTLIDLAEYKRKQAAPGLKITGRAFGFGRRMPIAQRYRPE